MPGPRSFSCRPFVDPRRACNSARHAPAGSQEKRRPAPRPQSASHSSFCFLARERRDEGIDTPLDFIPRSLIVLDAQGNARPVGHVRIALLLGRDGIERQHAACVAGFIRGQHIWEVGWFKTVERKEKRCSVESIGRATRHLATHQWTR